MSQKSENKEMIRHFNIILRNELTAINQYFLHAKILAHQGFAKLAAKEYEESIDEMKHADIIAQRVLYLGGLPNFQDLGKLHVGESIPEMIDADFDMEVQAIADLKAAITHADSVQDYNSSDLLQQILTSEEEHYLWLEQQRGLIAKMGVENYSQLQV